MLRQSNCALTPAIGPHISVAVRVLVGIATRIILVYAAIIIIVAALILIGMMGVTGIASGGLGIERAVFGVLD
jgi:hypothetical protein